MMYLVQELSKTLGWITMCKTPSIIFAGEYVLDHQRMGRKMRIKMITSNVPS